MENCIKKILGVPRTDIAWRAAIVVQGPYEEKYTKIVIEQFIYRNPEVLIILSTYLPPDEETGEKPLGSFLSSSAERALINQGHLVVILSKPPSQSENPEFWRTNKLNRNLQRLTSFVGLRHAVSLGIEFALKIRSDSFLGRFAVVNYLRDEVQNKFPVNPRLSNHEGTPRGRIVVSAQGTITNPRTWVPDPYHVREMWLFGYTADLLRYFDCSTSSNWRNGTGLTDRNPESSLCQMWIQDAKIEVDSAAELVGRFMLTEDASFVEHVRLAPRIPGWELDYRRYLREGPAYLKELYASTDTPCCVTSHEESLNLIRQYLTV